MLVGAVTGIEDREVHPAGVRKTVSRTRGRMTHDDCVRAHGLERQRGVLERFALRHRRSARLEVDDVSAQALGCSLERDASAGGILEKQVDDGLALKRREFLHTVTLRRGHLLCRIED